MLERIDRMLLAIAGAMVGGVLVITCAEVFCRFFLHTPMVWAEEASRYLFVWATFIATSVLVARDEHYAMPELVDTLPAPFQRVCLIAVRLLCAAFCIAVAWFGSQWAWRLRDANTPVLEIAQGAVYAIIPLSSAYMALRLLLRPARKADRNT